MTAPIMLADAERYTKVTVDWVLVLSLEGTDLRSFPLVMQRLFVITGGQ